MTAKKLSALFGLVVVAGCQSAPCRQSEYGLPPESQVGVATSEKSFVDRHPLFSSPRNYYRDSGDSPVVKVLAGTFVGVPVGVAKEVWQIGYGQ